MNYEGFCAFVLHATHFLERPSRSTRVAGTSQGDQLEQD
jgi:hypothetical protein